MEILSKSTKDTKELARNIAKKLKKGDILALYGDLGSGKTTFTSYLVHALGIEKRVQSPTFVIARKYHSVILERSDLPAQAGRISVVNHVDLYRLRHVEEVEDIGLEEIMNEGGITIIEWPEKAEEVLPEKTIRIKFEYKGENERLINVQNLN